MNEVTVIIFIQTKIIQWDIVKFVDTYLRLLLPVMWYPQTLQLHTLDFILPHM